MSDRLSQIQTEEEIDEILRIAVRQGGSSDMTLQDRLRQSASELGISEEALGRAAEEYYGKHQVELEHKEFQEYKKREFFSHFLTYGVVSLFLIGINIITKGFVSWAVYPILGWGIGVAIHAGTTFLFRSTEYEDEFEKWSKKRRKRDRSDSD